MPNLVTLAVDIGSRSVGWAALDERLLAHGVWDLRDAPDGWTAGGSPRPAAAVTLHRDDVTRLAVEAFHWRKDKPTQPQAPAIQQQIRVLCDVWSREPLSPSLRGAAGGVLSLP